MCVGVKSKNFRPSECTDRQQARNGIDGRVEGPVVRHLMKFRYLQAWPSSKRAQLTSAQAENRATISAKRVGFELRLSFDSHVFEPCKIADPFSTS